MKTSRISLGQYFTLIVLFLSSSATLINVGRFSGADIWIVLLCGATLGTVLFTIYHRISKLHGYQPLTAILRDVFGKWLGSLVVIAYIGYFLFLGSGLLKSTGDMVQLTLMQDANMYVILTLLMIPVVYGMILGVNAIGRTAEILFYVVCLAFIPLLLAVFTSDIFKVDNLLPILEHGFSGIKNYIFVVTLFPYGEIFAFLLLFPLIPNNSKGKILKYGYIGIGVATVILIVIDVLNVAVLGPNLAKNFVYPFYNAMKMVGISIVFERLDPIAILILMTTCFFKICIYFYASLCCMEHLIQHKFNYRQLAIPVGIVVIIAASFISQNRVENIYRAIVENPKFILPIFQLAIPALVWIITEIKYRKHPKPYGTEEE